MFSFFIYSSFLLVFLSFFLSSSGLGLEYFGFFLIPAREARNTVFYYKIQDVVFFVDLFFFDPYLFCF